jgi:hypothetical protein
MAIAFSLALLIIFLWAQVLPCILFLLISVKPFYAMLMKKTYIIEKFFHEQEEHWRAPLPLSI